MEVSRIRRRLLGWFARHARSLPWRGTCDPYRIWISEIMLQQTRVAAVVPYYERFLARFPDVESLARAAEADVIHAWSGLGYYSRARNLHRAARAIVRSGGFPRDHASILALPGVGNYTAAAIASIAFDLPHAVLDGNVVRVLSRLACDKGEITASATRQRLGRLAEQLLDRRRPGQFNQAVMELGATVCLPREPRCAACPVGAHCEAVRQGVQHELPVKLRRVAPVRLERTVLILERRGRLLLVQRTARPMAGFWELPHADQVPHRANGGPLGCFRHSITHHNYVFAVVKAEAVEVPDGFRWIPLTRLHELPLTTATRKALACYKV